MSFSFTLGWWLLPLAITLAVFGRYAWFVANDPPASGYGAAGRALGQLLAFLAALVVSLIVWLIYFIVLVAT